MNTANIILAFSFACIVQYSTAQDDRISDWVNEICVKMQEMEDLDSYSSKPIPNGVIVDFVFVDRYEVLEITDSDFTISVDPGKGEYCSKMTFKYIEINGDLSLVFSEVQSQNVMGKEMKSIQPWVGKETNCK